MRRVGFVGLGVMGKPMAKNLLAEEYDLVISTRTPSTAIELQRLGAEVASSPREAAVGCDAVITMLPDSAVVEEVITGEDGVLEGAREGTIIIDMSTIDPSVAIRLAAQAGEQGIEMLDAPVSGGDVGAKDGTLSIMVGGDPIVLQKAKPILSVLGTTIVHAGSNGAGQVVKACNQVVVGITCAAVSEALILASTAGVDPGLVIDALSGGLAFNRLMEVRRHNFLSHDFTPGFRVNLHHKDLTIALDAAADSNVALPLTAIVQQLFRIVRAAGYGDADHSAVLTVYEQFAAHTIGGGGTSSTSPWTTS